MESQPVQSRIQTLPLRRFETTLAAREGGYVEQIETQNIAWTPRNFYLLAFPERIVGFTVPSDRQLLAGWVKNFFIKPRTSPPGWADRAFYRAPIFTRKA